MGFRRTAGAAVAVLGLVASGAAASPAVAKGPTKGPNAGNQVVVGDLSGPYGIDAWRGGWLVAEQGASQVIWADGRGHTRTIASGVGGVSGVASWGNAVYSLTGGPNEEGEPPGGDFPAASVLRTDLRTGKTVPIADLQQYELDHNPDGQPQFSDEGVPYDALSNPFSMTSSPIGLLVADGGANDVLLVDPRTGAISTFYVPPNPTNPPACDQPDANGNPDTIGCDSVPTGVAVAHGNAYISTLGAFGPGAGRIYQVDLRTRQLERTWGDLFAPTGVAVGTDGAVYYSSVATDQVVRIAKDGSTSSATVASPTGLETVGDKVYASSGAFGGPGSIVLLGKKSFS